MNNPVKRALFPTVIDHAEGFDDAPADDSSPPAMHSALHTNSIPGFVVEAEKRLVGSVIADNAFYGVVSEYVGGTDFSNAATRAAFKAIEAIIERNENGFQRADELTLAAVQGEGIAASADVLGNWRILASDNEQTLVGWARIVATAANEQRMKQALVSASSVMESAESIDDRAVEISRIIDVALVERAVEARPASTFGDDAMANIISLAKRGSAVAGIPTGFRDLDAILSGFQKNQLIVIAGRPGMGKTALALSAALNMAAAGHPGVFATLEMSGEELSLRLISILSNVDSGKIRIGALSEADWIAVFEANAFLKTLPLKIVDLPGFSLGSAKRVLRRLVRAKEASWAMIDYMQIMDTDAKKPREQQISDISRGLKSLAKELAIPIVALSQLNRSLESRPNKRPILSDLRESGAIEQDADVILFVYRDEVYNPQSKDTGTAEVIIGKQRSGRVGDVRVRYQNETTGFLDLDEGGGSTSVTFDFDSRAAPTGGKNIADIGELIPAMYPRNQSHAT